MLKLIMAIKTVATNRKAYHNYHIGEGYEAGIALTGVGPGNVRAAEAESTIRGAALSDAAIVEAGRLAAEAATPQDDVRGSVEYKRNVVRVFTERGLREAANRARGA